MTILLRFATTNVPESAKRGLLRDRLERARRVNQWATRRKIDVRALQEAGTYAEQVDAETPIRKVLWARWNQIVRGRRVGNGADIRHWRWKSRLLDDLTIGRGEGAIHLAVVLITERRPRPKSRPPWVQKAYIVHKPTRRAANSSLRDVVDDVLRNHTRIDDAAGMPWTILGDFNGPFNHGVELGDHGVDSIRASAHFEPLGQTVVDRPLLSDHCFLIADAAVDV